MLYWVYLGMNGIRTHNIIGDRPFDPEHDDPVLGKEFVDLWQHWKLISSFNRSICIEKRSYIQNKFCCESGIPITPKTVQRSEHVHVDRFYYLCNMML
jgi:hypothetical protein